MEVGREKMLGVSIIVCSMRPELCEQMLVSIEKTIGIDHEAIVFDNREKGLGNMSSI